MRAVRGRKGAVTARTYRCSSGARGAGRSLFSSEAWKPLEKVFAKIERATGVSPEHTH